MCVCRKKGRKKKKKKKKKGGSRGWWVSKVRMERTKKRIPPALFALISLVSGLSYYFFLYLSFPSLPHSVTRRYSHSRNHIEWNRGNAPGPKWRHIDPLTGLEAGWWWWWWWWGWWWWWWWWWWWCMMMMYVPKRGVAGLGWIGGRKSAVRGDKSTLHSLTHSLTYLLTWRPNGGRYIIRCIHIEKAFGFWTKGKCPFSSAFFSIMYPFFSLWACWSISVCVYVYVNHQGKVTYMNQSPLFMYVYTAYLSTYLPGLMPASMNAFITSGWNFW